MKDGLGLCQKQRSVLNCDFFCVGREGKTEWNQEEGLDLAGRKSGKRPTLGSKLSAPCRGHQRSGETKKRKMKNEE